MSCYLSFCNSLFAFPVVFPVFIILRIWFGIVVQVYMGVCIFPCRKMLWFTCRSCRHCDIDRHRCRHCGDFSTTRHYIFICNVILFVKVHVKLPVHLSASSYFEWLFGLQYINLSASFSPSLSLSLTVVWVWQEPIMRSSLLRTCASQTSSTLCWPCMTGRDNPSR